MVFPATRLDLSIEMAFGADLGSSPLDWPWTDVSARRHSQSIPHTRGASSDTGKTNHSAVSFELDNNDGELTPDNTSSAWYPYVRRGVPIRAWAEGATPGLVLPGVAGAYCSTPHHNDFDFSGDCDLRMKVTPDQWSDAFGKGQVLVSKYGASGQRSWLWLANPDGDLELRPSTTGTAVTAISGSGSVEGRAAALRPLWIGITFDADNGSSDGTWKSYAWRGSGTPPSDITTWDLIGTSGDSAAGPGAMFSSTAPVEIGTVAGGGPFAGSVPRFRGVVDELQIRDGKNGTVVADPDFTAATEGDTTVTDSTGKVWTVHGTAAITTRRIRFCGAMDDLEIAWPHGDNEAGNAAQASECRARITASGILRRLDQGQKPIRSPIYRKVTTNNLTSSFLWGYWPAEDGDGAVRAAPAVAGDAVMTLTGFSGTDDTLPGSEALPTIPAGETGSWSAAVTDPAGFFDSWGVAFLFRMPKPDGTYRRIMAVETEGTAARWEVLYSSAGFRTRAVNGSETQLFSSDETAPFPGSPDWYVVYLTVQQSGGNMAWDLEAVPIHRTSGATSSDSGTVSGTVGKPTSVGNSSVTTPSDSTLAVGHIVVYDIFGFGWTGSWLDQAANAHIGESAGARFKRLCEEQGVAAEIVGDYLTDPLGDITLSEVMGAQQPGRFLEVLDECVKIDQGKLISRRATPGLVYRCRVDIEAQATVGLALDGTAEGFRPGLRAKFDDKGYRNDIEVAAVGGSKATARDDDAVDAQDLYDEAVTVNGVGGVNLGIAASTRPSVVSLVDSQLAVLAARRLHIATWPDPRIRRVTTELSIAPDLLPAWHDLAIGDRVTLDNLPAQWPDQLVELLLDGFEEIWTPTRWQVDLIMSAGGPWNTPYTPPAPSSPAIRSDGQTTAITSSTSTWTVTMPDTVNSGDEILIIFQPSAAGTPPTVSATGWSVLQDDTLFTDRSLNYLVKDSVDGTEGGTTVDFTIDQSSLGTAIAVAISGADDPANWAFGTVATGTTSTAPDPPPLTSGFGSVETLYIAVAAAFDDDETFTGYPTDYSHYTDAVNSGGGANASNELAIAARVVTAASEDPGAFSLSNTENWGANTIAIQGA